MDNLKKQLFIIILFLSLIPLFIYAFSFFVCITYIVEREEISTLNQKVAEVISNLNNKRLDLLMVEKSYAEAPQVEGKIINNCIVSPLHLELAALSDKNGGIVYRANPASENIFRSLSLNEKNAPLLEFAGNENKIYLISAYPMKAGGYMILGRELDSDFVSILREDAQANVEILAKEDKAFKEILPEFGDSNKSHLVTLKGGMQSIYILVKDQSKATLGMLHISIKRTLFYELREFFGIVSMLAIIISFFGIVLTLVFFRKMGKI